MQQFIKFIVDNWQFVSSAAISVVSFILLLIFKKRSKIFVSGDEFYSSIITFINEAEIKFGDGHGKEKLQYVLNCFASEFGNWNFSVMYAVEKILSTPHKKAK